MFTNLANEHLGHRESEMGRHWDFRSNQVEPYPSDLRYKVGINLGGTIGTIGTIGTKNH